MTQAMLPIQTASDSAKNAQQVTRTNDSQDGFSGTFRDQLDDRSSQESIDEVSVSGPQTAQDPTTEPAKVTTVAGEITGAPVEVIDELVASEELVLSIAQSGQALPGNEAAATLEEQQLNAGSGDVTDLQGLALQIPTASAPSDVEAAAVNGLDVVPTRVSMLPVASETKRSISASSAVVVPQDADETLTSAPTAGVIHGAIAQTKSEADKDLFAQSVARLNEAAAPAITQSGSSVAPATSPANPNGQSAFQSLPSSTAMPLSVDTPVANPGWGNAVGARLVWGATQGMQSATIEINPRDLGPVNVNLKVVGDETNITFVSQHVLVREAIEAALPRLREMFSSEGINLGGVDISNGEGRSDRGGGANANDDSQADTQSGLVSGAVLNEERVSTTDSLIDTFA